MFVAVAPGSGDGNEDQQNPENPDGTGDTTVPTDADHWVCNDGFMEPSGYMGGDCRIVLVQNGVSTTIYEGANPFGDDYSYNEPINGAPGVPTGTVEVYTLNSETGQYDTLVGTVELSFTEP